AKLFLEAGFNVVCDKPMTFDLGEALALRDLVKKSGKIFALTHNYTGYPMAKEARELVQRGELGTILKVVAQYPQGWLLRPIDAQGQKQAERRLLRRREAAFLESRKSSISWDLIRSIDRSAPKCDRNSRISVLSLSMYAADRFDLAARNLSM